MISEHEIQELKPLPNRRLTPELIEATERMAALMGRRPAGGPALVALMSLHNLAQVIIKNESGYYSKGKVTWNNKLNALGFILQEYGWYIEKDEILRIIPVVQKSMISSDGFICLAEGTKDIGAAKKMEINVPEEIKVYGIPEEIDKKFAEAVSGQVGAGIEQGNNGDSYELIPLKFLPGICVKISDVQKDQEGRNLNRKTGIIIISKHAPPLYCEGMNVNRLEEVQLKMLSVKVQAAITMVKSL